MAAVLHRVTPARDGLVRSVVAPFAAVLACTALALAALDLAPRLAGAEPRGFRRFGSIADLERATGIRLQLPAYFPASLAWPAASVRLWVLHPRTAVVSFDDRATGVTALTIYQTLKHPLPVPAAVRPPGVLLQTAPVKVAGHPGELTRVLLGGGQPLHDLTWRSGDHTFVLRYAGPPDTLMAMAESIVQAGPPGAGLAVPPAPPAPRTPPAPRKPVYVGDVPPPPPPRLDGRPRQPGGGR